MDLFAEIEKVILKFIWKFKGPRIVKKKKKSGKWKPNLEDLHFLISKSTSYYKTAVIKTIWTSIKIDLCITETGL